jgi:mono/diheme cytochrome c family protein
MRAALLGLLLALPATAAAADGQQLFAHNCAACHMPDGAGIPGAFPALAGNAFVTGDPAAAAATVLNGRGGMPSFRDGLTDEEVAAVLSYVRAHFGNTAAAVPAETVAATRTGKAADPARPMPAH